MAYARAALNDLFGFLGPPGDFIKNRDFRPYKKSENRQKSGKIGAVLKKCGNKRPTLGLLPTIYLDF
jgi:hypothetical protein